MCHSGAARETMVIETCLNSSTSWTEDYVYLYQLLKTTQDFGGILGATRFDNIQEKFQC
jgi:hypothetical protein